MSTSWHIRSPDDYNVEGGPAFGHGDHMNGGHPGMSLRDWFAGQALAGLMAACANPNSGGPVCFTVKKWAEEAYLLADAMLSAREADPS